MRSRVTLLCCALLLLPTALCAQEPSALIPEGESITFGYGQLRVDESDIQAGEVLVRFAQLTQHQISGDLTLGLFPGAGSGAVGMEGGPAWNVPLSRASILIRTGLTTVLANGGGLIGGYFGVGLVMRAGGRVGLRLDLARHRYLAGNGGVGAWQVSVGLTLLPRDT